MQCNTFVCQGGPGGDPVGHEPPVGAVLAAGDGERLARGAPPGPDQGAPPEPLPRPGPHLPVGGSTSQPAAAAPVTCRRDREKILKIFTHVLSEVGSIREFKTV